MRNIISIDTRDGCSCNAIVATDTKTNEIVIEVITGNDKKPQLKLINGEDTSYITLDVNQSNYVNIPSESWVLGGALQFQYEATGRTGELYTISFPDTINDITVSQISETEFSVKSLVIGTQPLTVKDIVNNLTSTDIYKVLGADMGSVLDGKITAVNNKVASVIDNDNNITANLIRVTDGMYVHDTGVNNGSLEGYVVLARIEVKYGWLSNAILEFDVFSLGGQKGSIVLSFNNVQDVINSALTTFTTTGNLPSTYYVRTVESDTVTFEIIVRKSKWQDFCITNLKAPVYIRERIDITFPNAFENTLRSDAVLATAGMDYFNNIRSIGTAWLNGDVVACYGTNTQVSLSSLLSASKIVEIWYDSTVTVDSSGVIDVNLYVGNYRNHSRSGLIFVSINDTGNTNLGFTCIPYLTNNNSWITYGDALFNLGANGGKISVTFSLINTQLHCIVTPATPSNFVNKDVNLKIVRLKTGV